MKELKWKYVTVQSDIDNILGITSSTNEFSSMIVRAKMTHRSVFEAVAKRSVVHAAGCMTATSQKDAAAIYLLFHFYGNNALPTSNAKLRPSSLSR